MKTLLGALAMGAVLGSAALPVLAQGPFGGMPPEIQAKMKAWQKWRENHKHITQLQQTMMGLRAMERDPKTQLTKAQARHILQVINAWKNKPKMTDDQAAVVAKQLTAGLTRDQLLVIATTPQFGRGGRGGFGGGMRPGGAGGPGGPGGPRPGGPPRFDPSRFPDPQDYNPLNPATMPFAKANPQMAARIKQGMDEFLKALQARAK